MVYTEVKKSPKSKYYYRVKSIRENKKFRKERIYLGKNLTKKSLLEKEKKADIKLGVNERNYLNNLITKIKSVLKRYNIRKAGIFGSYSVGKQKEKSDIDILIDPPRNIGFGFFKIQEELEKKLNKKVDLVTYEGLSPYLRESILKQEVRVL